MARSKETYEQAARQHARLARVAATFTHEDLHFDISGYQNSQLAAVFALMWLVTPDPGEESTSMVFTQANGRYYIEDHANRLRWELAPGKYKLVKVG